MGVLRAGVEVRVTVGVLDGVRVGRRVGVGPVTVSVGVWVGGTVGVMVDVLVALGVRVGTVGVGDGTGVAVQAGGRVGKARGVRSVPGTTRVTCTGRAVAAAGVGRLNKPLCVARTTMAPTISTTTTSATRVMSQLDEPEEAFTLPSPPSGPQPRRAPPNYTQL